MNYVGPYDRFISGLELSAAFYADAVAPVMRTHFPDVQYAAAPIGPGSDVLGFPTNFRPFEGDEAHLGHLGHMHAVQAPPVNHGVMLTTVPRYFRGYLDLDPLQSTKPIDWLVMSEQHLLMLTSGRVFHDAPGHAAPDRGLRVPRHSRSGRRESPEMADRS